MSHSSPSAGINTNADIDADAGAGLTLTDAAATSTSAVPQEAVGAVDQSKRILTTRGESMDVDEEEKGAGAGAGAGRAGDGAAGAGAGGAVDELAKLRHKMDTYEMELERLMKLLGNEDALFAEWEHGSKRFSFEKYVERLEKLKNDAKDELTELRDREKTLLAHSKQEGIKRVRLVRETDSLLPALDFLVRLSNHWPTFDETTNLLTLHGLHLWGAQREVSQVFIRECYKTLEALVMTRFDEKWPNQLVRGGKGIGKSVFGIWFALKRVEENKAVVYVHKGARTLLVRKDAAGAIAQVNKVLKELEYSALSFPEGAIDHLVFDLSLMGVETHGHLARLACSGGDVYFIWPVAVLKTTRRAEP